MIYKWNSLASFNLWHEAIKAELGIPHGGTLEYTDAFIVAENDVRAYVRESDTTICSDLLGVLSEAITSTGISKK